MYKKQRNYENIQKYRFKGTGIYEIPQIHPQEYDNCEWIGFNYAGRIKDRESKGIHFFLDDYQFIRLWNNIDAYLEMLRQYKYIMSPDFSLYTDFPKSLQIYNHYRKHWLAAYMQMHGIHIIPTICWSTADSFDWCFDGEPVHGTVAVSSIGTQMNQKKAELFINGYNEMLRRLQPEKILFYGNVPKECMGNIVRIRSFGEKWNEVQCNGW